MPPKLNGGSLKIAPERLCESGSRRLSNGQCGHPWHSHLHTSGMARGWTPRSIFSWLCFWLVVTLSVSGFVSFLLFRVSRFIIFRSFFHPLELRQKDRRSLGRTDTPSTRIPHRATLRSVKVSGPHRATCHTFRESTWLPPTRGVEPHETCLINPTELTRCRNNRGSLKKAFRPTETGLMKVQSRKTFGGMVATFGLSQ